MDKDNFEITIIGPAGKLETKVKFDSPAIPTKMKAKTFYDTVKSEGNAIIYTKESKEDQLVIVATRTFEDGGNGKKIVRVFGRSEPAF